ncbi:MAG: nucleotidyltransferase family protein [Anaerolineae bacterium]|nr:nucleotidyltransferase family protein [Anaerolineae bacterium]
MKPVTAVVLAAGASKRMGRAKLSLPWGDTTMLGAVLRVVNACSAENALVITGADASQTAASAAAAALPAMHNPNYANGEMVSSLQLALPLLEPEHAALVVLGDMPLLSADLIDTVIRAYRQSQALIIAPTYKGQRGHPVLFAPSLFGELLALPSGESAPRAVVRRHVAETLLVPVESDAVLIDIDTPNAYEQFRPKTVR